MRYYALILAAAIGLLPQAAHAQQGCQFAFGFKVLHDAIPAIVGGCLTPELPRPDFGSAQVTDNGVLLWDKANDITAFYEAATERVFGFRGSAIVCLSCQAPAVQPAASTPARAPAAQGDIAQAICAGNGGVWDAYSSFAFSGPAGPHCDYSQRDSDAASTAAFYAPR